MNQLIQSITCLVFLFSLSNWGHAQTIHYVDPSATGTGDGTSWENAFTDLQTPLSAASAGDEIWVVSGTYSPSPTDQNRSTSFILNNQVSIYGGFAGTESSVDERDLSMNPTILSGDNAENDGADPDSVVLADNAYTILQAVSSSASGTTIDGFVFARAYGALIDSAELDSISRGGAIYSKVALNINNCLFQNNFSFRGGGIYWQTEETGSTIRNTAFRQNRARRGGALFLSDIQVSIDTVDFSQNEAIEVLEDGGFGGAIYNLRSSVVYTNTQFIENNSEDDGGGIYALVNRDRWVNCLFDSNRSDEDGGAIYQVDAETYFEDVEFTSNFADDDAGVLFTSVSNDTFSNCVFDMNEAGDDGGAFYTDDDDRDSIEVNGQIIESVEVNGDHVFIDCTIENNSSGDNGGFLITSGGLGSVQFYNCDINNNMSPDNGGVFFGGFRRAWDHLIKLSNCRVTNNFSDDGGVITIQRNILIEIDSCFFNDNAAGDDGGVITIGSQSSYRSSTLDISNSIFETNDSRDGGGAIDIFGDSSEISIINCQFIDNGSDEGAGGAMDFDGNHEIIIENCSFNANFSLGATQEGTGGAIDVNGGGELINGEYGNLDIINCLFEGNSAAKEGGAIAIEDYNANIVNSIFAYNETFADGFGTIMLIGGQDTSKLTLINNSFAFNSGTQSAGLAQSSVEGTDSTEATYAETNLLNNIFYNPGSSNYADVEGTSGVTSWGGNMYHDNSFEAFDDQDVVFFNISNPYAGDFGELDYTLEDTSFAANKGILIEGITPLTDFTGATRIVAFDSLITPGAYEVFIDTTTSVFNPGISKHELSVWPNVTNHMINLKFENEHRGSVKVMVMDLSGRLMFEIEEEKRSNQFRRTYQVGNLPSGMYVIRTMSKNQVGDARFMVAQ